MGPLRNPRHEQFAQCIAAGQPRYKAYALAYGRQTQGSAARSNASRLWSHLKTSRKIRQRVDELMRQRRKASDYSYEQLLDDTLDTIDLAREAGQHAAALKGLGMIGSEMFQAFVEKRETINIDIRVNSKAELRALLVRDYGEQLAEQIWQSWSNKPKLIEHDANNDVTFDGAVVSDSEVERTADAKLQRLALESLTNPAAPKLK